MSGPYDIHPSPSAPITSEMLNRWKAYMSAIPLPDDGVPRGGIPLEGVSREALLTCPPHVLAHIIQTASQGGLEVISPRQTPMTSTMVRRTGGRREIGDHDVFSKAQPSPVWPCISPGDDDDLDFLLPDEPLAPPVDMVAKREKTRTKSLVTHGIEVADPVLMCLVKGRATIDILNRPDVAGDGYALAMLLAWAWGIKVDDIMDLGAYTLGVEGPLQRHAMKVDEVYSVLYAPVQSRSCITVGNVDTSKALLLPDYAIDWARCRVFCEAVFYNACMIEGHPIRYMGVPHNASAAGSIANSANVVTFSPAPSIAWCYAPQTFALTPRIGAERAPHFTIPEDVRTALQSYVKRVRPVSYVLSQGNKGLLRQTQATRADPLTGETIASGYTRTIAAVTTGMARGRTAMPAVRNAIYVCLEGASVSFQLRIAHYTKIVQHECKVHLRSSDVPINVIRDLAYQFKDVGSHIREHIAREAERRNNSVTDWWEDAISQVPLELQNVIEGSAGWAMVGLWLLFKKPTDRWKSLEGAINFRAHMLARRGASCAVPLPAEKGSLVRLVAAGQAGARSVADNWCGYYKAVADVGIAVGKEAVRLGKVRAGASCIMGARLWEFRARCLKASNVHPLEKEGVRTKKSQWHFQIAAEPVDLVIKPAPYTAFKSLVEHLRSIEFMSKRQLSILEEYTEEVGAISPIFKDLQGCFMAAAESKVTRYVLNPRRMAKDLEKGWNLMVDDLRSVAAKMVEEAKEDPARKRHKTEVVKTMTTFQYEPPRPMVVDEEGPSGAKRGFWSIYGELDVEVAEALDFRIQAFDEVRQEDIYEGTYGGLHEIELALTKLESDAIAASISRGETVR